MNIRMKFWLSILLYPVWAILSLAFTVFAMLIGNRVAVLFCDWKGNLPRWLKWFQTFDATCDEGMLARRRYLAAGSPAGEYPWDDYIAEPTSRSDEYQNRLRWLNRNPAYGFDYALFGIHWCDEDWLVIKYETSGKYTLFIATGPAWNIYYQGPWGTYKLGWKAWNNFKDGKWKDPTDGTKFDRAVLTFSPNPFKRVKAK